MEVTAGINLDLAVFKNAFHFVIVPLPPGRPGRVHIVIVLRQPVVLGRFRPGSGGNMFFIFLFISASSAAGMRFHINFEGSLGSYDLGRPRINNLAYRALDPITPGLT